MRYVLQGPWPVGAAVISGVVDTDQRPDLRGVIPPPTSIPMNTATREWLVEAYRHLGDVIPQVPLSELSLGERLLVEARNKMK